MSERLDQPWAALDLEGAVVWANPAFANAVGRRLPEVVGHTLVSLLPESEGAEVGAALARVTRGALRGAPACRCTTPRERTTRAPVCWQVLADPEAERIYVSGGTGPCASMGARLQAIIEHLPIALYAVDCKGRITAMAGGAAIPNVVGKSAFEPFRDPGITAAIERALAGEAVTLEGTFRQVPFEARLEPVVGPGGRPDGFVGVSVDVTERMRQQAELRRSEERLRVVGSHAWIALFSQDLELRYTWVQHGAGVPADHIVGKTDEEVFREHGAAIAAFKRRALESGADARATVRADMGRERWLDLLVSPTRDAAGAVCGLTGVAIDSTDRVRHERERAVLLESLDQKHRWHEAMIDRAPGGVLLAHDDERLPLRVNPRLARMVELPAAPARAELAAWGGRLEDAHGRGVSLEALVDAVLRTGALDGTELHVVTPSGREAWLLAHGARIDGVGGEGAPAEALDGAVLLFEELTAMKELDRLRDEWTRVIAHDLLQPVNAIQLNAAVLARQHHGGSVGDCAAHILAGTKLLARMIGDLRDKAAIEAQRLQIRKTQSDLVTLVTAVVQRFGAGHRVQVDAPSEPLLVDVDPQRIEQVLVNLLGNAEKYGEKEGPILLRVTAEHPRVRVDVKNRGECIPKEDRERIFERYRRLPRHSRGAVEGLGLGLYIARGIVEAHGGRIWVESDGPHDTAFCFTLPTEG